MLEKLFRSKAEVNVMGVVLFEEGLHLRGIARSANVSPPEAKKELDNMVSLGILKMEKRGNMNLYYVNETCPFLDELRQLYLKTEGIGKTIKEALLEIKGIEYSFIYGSVAKGRFGERSDVDVFIEGSADEEIVSRALLKAQGKLGREINFVLWTKRDFLKKLKERGQFMKSLIKGKKIWLAGDEGGFARAVKKKDD